MKILFTPSDNNLAGAFQSMVRLCKILKESFGCDILVALRCNGKGKQLLEEANIPYVKIKSFNWVIPDKPKSCFRKIELIIRKITKPLAIFLNYFSKKQYKKLIKKEKIDIVHLNTTYIYIPAIAAKEMNIPIVWHLREFLEEDQSKSIWNKKKGYELISKADRVITISESLHDKYKKLLPNANLIRIYNGLDENYYLDRKHEIFNNKRINLLMVGTINQSKGQIQAIYACKKILEAGIDNFKLSIVGDINNYAKRLIKLVNNLKLQEYVVFEGIKKDTARYYKQSDVVLVCSKFEAFGRVTVEASMAGCLVIGANTGGTTELINNGHTGFLYESGNVDNLTKTILRAINNKKNSQKIAKEGRKNMLAHYTAMQNAKAIYDVYNKVLIEKEKHLGDFKNV